MLAPPKAPDSPLPALDRPEETITGIFEPPSSPALTAISRNKTVVCACAVVLALIGAGVGLSRASTHTASATLQVGQVNPNSPGFYGYVQSAASLATAFSRSITAEPVLAAVHRKLGLAPAQAAASLAAEPIPLSPAFRVIASARSGSAAIVLANVAANAVVEYESKSNSANPQAASLLQEYREASVSLQHADATLARLERRHGGRHPSTGGQTRDEAETRAAAERNVLAVRLRAIGNAYTAAVASQAPRSGLVSLLAAATSATSDRSSKVELYGFAGLAAGIVLGCLLAILRQRRRVTLRPAPGM
jgi:hypothetical protein